jgi:hypothetical protein
MGMHIWFIFKKGNGQNEARLNWLK